MDPSTSCPTSPPSTADAVNASPGDPPQSPVRLPAAVVAKRRIMKTVRVGSPVRRSPRLSCLPPPQPPTESHDTQDPDESGDDESESVNDVVLHLSRDETPENDDLPPDEPSSVLANRIMRAHDNPSPPPQDLAHPGINYVPGKDGQFPLPIVSVPPSPFRSISLLERLNLFSNPLFDPPRSPRTSPSGARLGISGSSIIPLRDFISPESSSPFITSAPTKSAAHEDLASTDTIPSSSAQCTVDDFPSRPSHHVCEPANLVGVTVIEASSQPIAGLHVQSMAITSPLESEVRSSPPTPVVDVSSNPVVPSASDVHLQRPLPHSERRRSDSKYSFAPLNAKSPSSHPSNENDQASGTETIIPGGKDSDAGELSSMGNHSLPFLPGEQESKSSTMITKEVDSNFPRRLDSLPLHSTDSLARLCLPSEPSPSIEQTILPTEFISTKPPPVTPPCTPIPSVPHPDFSRTSVQRPLIAPAPVRVNSARKLSSPSKFSLEVGDIRRTPAQRVPIETAFGCENSSFQRTVQLSTGSDQSRPGHFLTIRTPVFSRPALDDPPRSPAKRIPMTDSAASPTRGHQSSPTRLGLRARSASVEPRPLGTILARSRSVEPCATISKPDNPGKIKELKFPAVPIPQRAGSKLPFPLISSQKSSSDLPQPIPEEHEDAEIGNSGTDATLSRPTQCNPISQLRQPPTNSRIPRIGNKPYARPPKNGKTTASTTTSNITRAPRPPPYQLGCKNSGVGNSNAEVASNDQHLVGSLKRKRGVEATANSRLVMVRHVVPGILSDKYAPKPAKPSSQVQAPTGFSPPKVPQPLKFRKVVDGMLSARYTQAKAHPLQTELFDPTSLPPSPLSELSDEGPSDENFPPTAHPPAGPESKTPDHSQTNVHASVGGSSIHEHSSLYQDVDGNKPSSRPRRTSRTRKPAQQQYVLDVFSSNTSSRPPPARRKPWPRTEGDRFVGMSATALKALTTSNTTKNQQIVAVLATEVIRKEGLRPESPTVKARTILQKQRDERDMRRRERTQRKAQMDEEGPGGRDAEGQSEPDDGVSPDARTDQGENDCAVPQKHRRGPGDEEDYETPERPERLIEPLRLEGVDRKVKPVKQVKWHRGLSTAVYLDGIDPKPKSGPRNVVVRGCLAPTSRNLPLDPLGNLVDMDSRPFPELVTEHIVVKRYLYDNDIEPEPIPAKVTRSRSSKSKS